MEKTTTVLKYRVVSGNDSVALVPRNHWYLLVVQAPKMSNSQEAKAATALGLRAMDYWAGGTGAKNRTADGCVGSARTLSPCIGLGTRSVFVGP